MNKINLQEKLFSRENIYAAIYSLESYINEPNLLKEVDYKLFCELKDKHDKKKISNTIARCKRKLQWVYKDNNLFEAKVYFKLKSYKEGQFTFRPIHTCDLITQICIVAMLQPIMFNDNTTRRYSEISEQMPENFYGNKPSIDLEHLYQRWQTAYKKYSDAIIDKTREYYRNNKFSKELNLDLKDFFPSVDPALIINDIVNKCKSIYEDIEFLKQTLVKLLYFRLNPINLLGWQSIYYPDNPDIILNEHCTTRGIPQGLPQAPFFGNIVMTSIASILNKKINGDALYYVDDSVIFSNVSDKEFSEIVSADINEEVCIKTGLARIGSSGKSQRSHILDQLGEQRKAFQENIKYEIAFHSKSKSFIRPIADSYAVNGNLSFLRRQVSMGASIYRDTEENEDISSLQKVTHIREIIEQMLRKEKDKLRKNNDNEAHFLARNATNDALNETIANKVKLLRRHLRFFKFRELVLKYRKLGELPEPNIMDFENRLLLTTLDCKKEKEEYMENFEEDIFLAEYRFILQYLSNSRKRLQAFIKNIHYFERRIAPSMANTSYLYFSNDADGCRNHNMSKEYSYNELSKVMRQRYGMLQRTNELNKRKVLLKEVHKLCSHEGEAPTDNELIPKYAKFVFRNSSQYRRQICNALCSEIFNVDISDSLMIYKRSSEQMSYTEFRILAYIRNKFCDTQKFYEFVSSLFDEESIITDSMPVDAALTSVLSIFIKHVSVSKYVDNLIQTHRIVASLWKNGSKFLNDYTLHNEDHAICLIRQSVHLCKTIDYLNLKHQDFYPLFLACYLHDISMVLHPDIFDFTQMVPATSEILTKFKLKCSDHIKKGIVTHHDMLDAFLFVFDYFEKSVRNSHARDSAKFIQNHAKLDFSYIDIADLEIAAEVGEAHGAAGEAIYNEKSYARKSSFSKKYLKILLRLADLLDMCSDRISVHRMTNMLGTMSTVSIFHWISHLMTQKAEISTRYHYTAPSDESDNYIIHETLQVNIYLHSLQEINYNNPKICENCHLTQIMPSEIVGLNEAALVRGMKISPSIRNKRKGYCPLACAWHMKKNKWLFDEMVFLVKYLNETNSKLFETNFEINYICLNEKEATSSVLTGNSLLVSIMDELSQ